MSDLVRTVAAIFRRKGATEMSPSDFKLAVSLDLRWFAPADAKKLLAHAEKVGLVEAEGELLRARFDVERVDIPVAFRPGLGVLEEVPATPPPPARPPAAGAAPAPATAPAGSPADEALSAAARLSGEPLDALRHEAAEERERRGRLLTPDVAALVVARRRGVDVRPFAARAGGEPPRKS